MTKTKTFKPEQPHYNKVPGCVYPQKYGCKGCEYNSVPDLRDGGCLLLKKSSQEGAEKH